MEEPPGRRDEAIARLATWYATHERSRRWLAGEWESLVALIRTAVAERSGDLAWQLADVTMPFLESDRQAQQPFWRDTATWTFLAETARTSGDDRRLARALLAVGRAYDYDGFVAVALGHLGEAARLATADPDLRAAAHKALGHALRNAGRHPEAIAEYTQALAIYRTSGQVSHQADVLDGLGNLHLIRHETAQAMEYLTEAAELRTQDNPVRGAWTRLLLGIGHMIDGRRADAERDIRTAIALFRQSGDRPGEAYAIRELGWLAWNDQRYADAVRIQRDAERIFAGLRLPVGVGLAQESAGDALAAAGDHAAAVGAFERSAATFRDLGDAARGGISELKLAEALARLGRGTEAAEHRRTGEHLLDGVDLPEAANRRARLDAIGVGMAASPGDAGSEVPDPRGARNGKTPETGAGGKPA